MAKSLVTGGAGFIGAHVTNHLIKMGYQVVVLDDLRGGFEENVNPKAKFVNGSINDNELLEKLFAEEKFDYVLLSSVEDIVDLKAVFDSVYKCCHPHTRLIVVNYNYLWNPLVQLAESLKLKIPQNLHNWISVGDLNNMLVLSGYEKIVNRRIVLLPYNIPVISYLMNRFVARLPFFRHFTMLRITLARMDIVENHSPSVSIIIPCKNEAGNVEDARETYTTNGFAYRNYFLR